MTLYNVTGTFLGAVPFPTLSGTISITGTSTITAMDLSVSNTPVHFTQIYFNQAEPIGRWLLSAQAPGSCECFGGEEDYITMTFTALPGLQNQAKILNGAAVHNSYRLDGSSLTTYYGLGLGGTICPLEGCVPWPEPPPKGVPGPVAGSGLVAILMFTFLIRKCAAIAKAEGVS